MSSVGGVKVSIVAFQAIDPGSIPGWRTFFFRHWTVVNNTDWAATSIPILLHIVSYPIPYGLVVRIPGFHPGGPGSIPGVGTLFFLNPVKREVA